MIVHMPHAKCRNKRKTWRSNVGYPEIELRSSGLVVTNFNEWGNSLAFNCGSMNNLFLNLYVKYL